jgi:uncharacterized membrane protein YfhO
MENTDNNNNQEEQAGELNQPSTDDINSVDAETAIKEEPIIEEGPDFFERLGNKAIWLALGLSACIAFYVYKDFLLFEKVLLFKDIGSDSINFNLTYWTEISNLYHTDGIPKWSFHNGMGNSMFLFYQGDPFNQFLFLLGKDNLPYGFAYIEVIKIVLTTLLFFKYLEKLEFNNFVKIIGSLLFAFGGWMILGTSGWYMFSTQVFYFALIIYALENYLKNTNWILLTIAVALSSCSDLISSIQYLFFCVAYLVFRSFENDTKQLVSIIKKGSSVIAIFILGIGLAGIYTVNYFYFIFGSARVVGNSNIVNYGAESPLTLVSKSEGLSVLARLFSNDLLGAGSDYKGFSNYLEGPTLYIGLIVLIFVIQSLFILNRKLKILYGITLLLVVMALTFPYVRYAFWGFQLNYYRIFSFFISFILLYIGLRAFDNFIKTKKINKSALVGFVLVTSLIFLTNFIFPELMLDSPTSLTVVGFIVLYALLIYFGNKSKSFQDIKFGIMVVVLFELVTFSNKTVNDRDHLFTAELEDKKGFNDYSLESINYIKSFDTTFYRVAKMFPSGLSIHQSMNDAMMQNFNGLIGYTAFHNKNYLNFLQLNDALDANNTDDLKWVYKILSKPKLFSFAGAKYIIDKGENFNYDTTYIHCIKKMNGISIFKNDLALPLFFFQDNWIKENDFKKLSKKNKSHALFYASVLPNESNVKFENELNADDTVKLQNLGLLLDQAKVLQNSKITTNYFSNNKILLDVQVDKSKILQTTIPFHDGWSVLVDGKLISPFIANGGLLAFNLAKGDKQIVLEFHPTHLKFGFIITIISIIVFVFYFFLRIANKKRLTH